jgi:hypothetical protein
MRILIATLILAMFMTNSLAWAGDIGDINKIISKYGKHKIIDYILNKRQSITIDFNGNIEEMTGTPSDEYVTAKTIKRDFDILKTTPEEVVNHLAKHARQEAQKHKKEAQEGKIRAKEEEKQRVDKSLATSSEITTLPLPPRSEQLQFMAACRSAIKYRIRQPLSDASFPETYSKGALLNNYGTVVFSYKSDVYIQNRYGATSRQDFLCITDYKTHKISDLMIGGIIYDEQGNPI